MSYLDDSDVEVEYIDPGVSEHPSDMVSNVIYGPVSRKAAKKLHDRDEAFYKFVKSLNPNRDVVTEKKTKDR